MRSISWSWRGGASGMVTLAVAVRAGGSGDITETPRVLWKYTKGTAYVPSPIAYGDHVYLVTDKGILTCLDARTGEVKYEGGRVPIPATLMASPVAYEGKILLSSMEGDTFVIKAGPVHEVLRTNTLGEPIAASRDRQGPHLHPWGIEPLRDRRGPCRSQSRVDASPRSPAV